MSFYSSFSQYLLSQVSLGRVNTSLFDVSFETVKAGAHLHNFNWKFVSVPYGTPQIEIL